MALTTALLILSFALLTYLDRAQLYQNIGAIAIASNLAAYLFPALILYNSQDMANSFSKTLGGLFGSFLISIVAYVCFLCAFNFLTVWNFLETINLFHFVLFNLLVQCGYALVSALIVTIVLKILIRADP